MDQKHWQRILKRKYLQKLREEGRQVVLRQRLERQDVTNWLVWITLFFKHVWEAEKLSWQRYKKWTAYLRD